jgi:hypothetical protein
MKYETLGMPCQDFDTVICLVVQSNLKNSESSYYKCEKSEKNNITER